jgi:hypothetical protein
MGAMCGSELRQEDSRTQMIDAELEKDRFIDKTTIKLLLLGLFGFVFVILTNTNLQFRSGRMRKEYNVEANEVSWGAHL